jgi:hypothetical protein
MAAADQHTPLPTRFRERIQLAENQLKDVEPNNSSPIRTTTLPHESPQPTPAISPGSVSPSSTSHRLRALNAAKALDEKVTVRTGAIARIQSAQRLRMAKEAVMERKMEQSLNGSMSSMMSISIGALDTATSTPGVTPSPIHPPPQATAQVSSQSLVL